MYQMYEEVLGEIQNETQYVVEHLGEKAQRAQYKPVTELSIEAVRYYNEELKDAELKALKDWQDSEISFQKSWMNCRLGRMQRTEEKCWKYRLRRKFNHGDRWIPHSSVRFRM